MNINREEYRKQIKKDKTWEKSTLPTLEHRYKLFRNSHSRRSFVVITNCARNNTVLKIQRVTQE